MMKAPVGAPICTEHLRRVALEAIQEHRAEVHVQLHVFIPQISPPYIIYNTDKDKHKHPNTNSPL